MASPVATSLLALALPLAAYLGGGLLTTELAAREEPAGAQKPLNLRFGYSAADLTSYWQAFKPSGLEGERRFLEADLIFPFLYGGALATGMLLLWAALGRPFNPAPLFAVVAITLLADWTENLVQLRQICRFIRQGSSELEAHWINVASAATMVKLAGSLASIVVLLSLVVATLLRGAR